MIKWDFLGNNDIFSKVFVTNIWEVCDEIRRKYVNQLTKTSGYLAKYRIFYDIDFPKKLQNILEYESIEKWKYKNKEPRGKNLEALKVAATYSPTTCSTIGVAELNDPVRNGKGWDLSAITTLIVSVKLRV